MKNKHLTLNDRLTIQIGLSNKESFRSIALSLGKSPTTISREIRRHSQVAKVKIYGRVHKACINRMSCDKYQICSPCRYKRPKDYCHFCAYCNLHCSSFLEEHCPDLEKPPYSCNACAKRASCTLNKKIYDAKYAHMSYTSSWKEAREGFYLTGEEILRVDELVSPRIKQGQSI